MAHALRVQHKRNYLHITVTGDNTPKDVEQYLSEVREACIAEKCPHVLIEENLRGPGLGLLEMFKVIAGAARPSTEVSCIAYVDVNPEHQLSAQKFAETVATNRGMIVRVFEDLPKAEEWLAEYAQGSGNPPQ